MKYLRVSILNIYTMKHIKLFESNETSLIYTDKYLTYLPELPNSLERLDCDKNKLTSIPELPDSLKYLNCDNNQLTILPTLPNSLEQLYCDYNKLTSLPELPDSLERLDCDKNELTHLPTLPNSLEELHCNHNPFELPLSTDIINRFGFNSNYLYTKERKNTFKTEEWQRYFLTEYPERYKDINWLVLPQIKEEFDYLYTSEELGLI